MTLTPPSVPAWTAPGYSNFDHDWTDFTFSRSILDEGGVAQHSGIFHWGVIWFQDGQFHEQVWVKHSVVAVVSRDSLGELIEAVNDEYGWE